MPIYDLECSKCGTRFEGIVAMNEIPFCECGSPARKLPAASKSYEIKGDNSASETPKRLRREEK